MEIKVSADPADYPMHTHREFLDAIATERERCAKIAERLFNHKEVRAYLAVNGELTAGVRDIHIYNEDVAAEIRKGE
jgi:hypothetical protein